MSLRKETACDFGECPYAFLGGDCEYWRGAEEPADQPEVWDESYLVLGEDSMGYADFPDDDDCDYEVGYDPYMGCYSDDC